MNIVIFDKQQLEYESFWRTSKNDKSLDSKDNKFPWPKQRDNWPNQNNFINQLKYTQSELNKNNCFDKYDVKTECHICKEIVNSKLYKLNNIRWENGLVHYIEKHNIKPSDKFIDIIFKYDTNSNYNKSQSVLHRLNGKIISINKMRYIKIDQNQLLIMDGLMEHGGKKIYSTENKNNFRYSEHVGLLDFNNTVLEKLLIYATTDRVDEYDEDIFLPGDLPDALDYEYIFHTHPPTPGPGGRATIGILYEFPSVGDILFFIDHYNDGNMQGSIVIAAEGLYLIKKLNHDLKKIKINENEMVKNLSRKYYRLQSKYIKLYGKTFTNEKFYSTIAQNLKPINSVNKILNKFQLHIDFFPRIKNSSGAWIIDTVYVPVYPIEIKK